MMLAGVLDRWEDRNAAPWYVEKDGRTGGTEMREGQTAPKATWAWAAWLTALCVGIVIYGFLRPSGNTSNIAYLIGYNLPIGLVVWGIFQFTVSRKRGRGRAGVAFFSVWCALVAGSLVGYAQQRKEAVQAVSAVQTSYTALMAKSSAPAATLPHDGSGRDGESAPSGQFGEMTRYMKDLMLKAAALQEDYKAALLQIRWNTILDPSRLQHDDGLAKSRNMLQQASDIVREYHSKNDQLLVDERAAINNLKVSANVREAMRRGFDKNAKAGRQQIDDMWDIQSRILSKFGKIIDLLDSRRGTWHIAGKHIIFSKQNDLDEFNNYLHSVRALTAEEHAMRDQNNKAVENNLSQLKDELSR